MRATIFILSVICLGGCAVNKPVSTPRAEMAEAVTASYEESPATALVFDPPSAGEKPVELTRDERQPAAFVGFDGPITTSFWIYTEDWQDIGGGHDRGGDGLRSRFQRDAQISQTGVRTR